MSMKVLLVDDEPGIRNVLSIYLKDAGYKVYTAEDGFSASNMLEDIRPDIVLTDIKMPGTDGLDLLKFVKARDIQAEVIMITGHGNLKLAIESLKMDAVDFITKPIDNDKLDIALKRAKEKISAAQTMKKYKQTLDALVQKETQKCSASEQEYARFFNALPDFMTRQDKNQPIEDSNSLFEEHFEPGPGKKCYEAFKQLTTPCPNCPVKKSVDDGKSHTGKMDVTLRDGSIKRFFIQTSPTIGSDGKVNRVMGMLADVTFTR